MRRNRSKFYPGWKMTWDQYGAYWRLLTQAARAEGITDAIEKERLRKRIHLAAFGEPRSAKDIDHLKGFDDFKAAALAIIQPANVDAQMRQQDMPRVRLVHACRDLAPEAYIVAEYNRKRGNGDFHSGHAGDWESLDESDLTMLRNHLKVRAAHLRWDQKPAAQAEAAAREEKELEEANVPF